MACRSTAAATQGRAASATMPADNPADNRRVGDILSDMIVPLQVEFEAEDEPPPEDIEQRPVGVCGSVESGVDRHARRLPIERILNVQIDLKLAALPGAQGVREVEI